MEEYIEPSDLLLESDLISEEEKQNIIEEIDKGFISSSQNISSLKQLSAKSSGLYLPLIISIISIVGAIIILLIFKNFILENNEISVIKIEQNTSGTEWKMLKTYMEASTKKLEDKNWEIDKYKVEIVNYDLKLSTLRQLLIVKKDTEKRLALEREKLITEGIDEVEIDSKISRMEETLVSDLAPGMINFYNLSIDDLNNQIDQVLDDKAESEEKLELSIIEKKELVTETDKIQEQVDIQESENLLVPEIIETMNKMNEITDQYEHEKKVRNEISALYLHIFQDLEKKEFKSALDKIEDIQNVIGSNSQNIGHRAIDQLPMQLKIVELLKDYVLKNQIDSEALLSLKIQDEESVPEIGLEDLILLGTISIVQFDLIYIDSISGYEVKTGMEFYVFKRNNKSLKLGYGIITDISESSIAGKLETHFPVSGLPEADDLVYIKAKL